MGKTAGVDGEVGTRLKKAATTYQMWRRKVFRSKSFTKKTKVHVFRVMVCLFFYMEQRHGQLPGRNSKDCMPS